MNDGSELSRLFAAERAQVPSAKQTAHGWQGLQNALAADLPPLPVAHGPLNLGVSLATKSLVGSSLLAFAVTTAGLGVHAVWLAPVASSSIQSSTTRAAEPPPAPELPAPSADRAAAETARSVAPAAPPRPKSSSNAGSTFAEELRLIKAAKQELDAGRPHLARVWLEQHARLYPNGIFGTERAELQRRLGSRGAPAANFPETSGR